MILLVVSFVRCNAGRRVVFVSLALLYVPKIIALHVRVLSKTKKQDGFVVYINGSKMFLLAGPEKCSFHCVSEYFLYFYLSLGTCTSSNHVVVL